MGAHKNLVPEIGNRITGRVQQIAGDEPRDTYEPLGRLKTVTQTNLLGVDLT